MFGGYDSVVINVIANYFFRKVIWLFLLWVIDSDEYYMFLRERLSLYPLSLLLWTFPNPFVFNYLVTFYNTDILFVRKWSLGFIAFLFSFFVLAFVEGLLCQHYCDRLVICCHSSFIHHDRDLMRLHITIFDINYKYFCEKNLS